MIESRTTRLSISFFCIMILISGMASTADSIESNQKTYLIVDTGQLNCYDTMREITCPSQGQDFFGQDAEYSGNQPKYEVSSDGQVVQDKNTGLTWQRSPDTNGDSSITTNDKLTWKIAQTRPAELNKAKYGGYTDWRLPTIKELYSLITFTGRDPNPESTSISGLIPFINTNYFKFAYGDTTEGDRIIDSQYASCTLDVSEGWNGDKLFGVNFADGRIKGYGLSMPGQGGQSTGGNISNQKEKPPFGSMPDQGRQSFTGGRTDEGEKTFFVICVRGNPEYGKNSFISNSNGTITDKATGLMWSQSDSSTGMNWKDALSWVQTKNATNYLGHNDWRLPNAKELQSIVDYSRSPDATDSAAIDPLFTCTNITNEAGQADCPYYWTGTTHLGVGGAERGVYIAFGRAMGYMNGQWQDVHGAGAQRSDPKIGGAADYPQGHGPQGDAIRVDNYVRLVRDEK